MSNVAETRPVGEKSQSVWEYVVVKSIDIVFDDGIEPSKHLDVFVADEEKSAEWINVDLPERTRRWSFKDGLYIFPNSKLSIRPLHSRKTKPMRVPILQKRKHIDSYNILAKDVISFCNDPNRPASSSSVDYTGAPPGNCSKITLNVILGEFSSALVEVDTTSLNPDAKAEVLESISSSKSLQEAVSQLRSVLGVAGANVEVIQNLENVVKTFASVHPIAQAAVSALLIPYKLLEAEHKFKKDIQSLADEMRFLLTLLEDERWIARLSSTRDTVMEIMKGVIDTSLFINHFVNKSRIKQFGAAQTRSKLDEHVERLKKLRGNFETALNVRNAEVISDIASAVNKGAEDAIEKGAREFLKEKLEPAMQQPLGDLCLPGTRTTILHDIEKWLKDTSRPNVLWISGAPGAGKSTISGTVVKKILRFNCARFFVKRGATPELRDPRRIWRSIAFDLAKMHHGVKDDITKMLHEKEAEYPKDAEVGDQFHDLLEAPIQKHAESFPTDRPCVVVIDALDECRTSDGDWSDLLRTLANWSKLPPNVKLIVTSRNEKDIRDRLQAVSEPIILETGSDTSEDTSNDIQLFFRTKFQEMGVADKSWPGADKITRLTKYAAGLFIWAKTVVAFANEPHRLEDVCNDMSKGSADICRLYGQILLQTLSNMQEDELDFAKFVLAAVSVGKSPFTTQDLVEFQASDDGVKKERTRSIAQMVIKAFSPIINVREPYKLLSVCHKTLSDFLTNETRMQDVIKQTLERAQKPVDEGNLLRYTMRCSEQNGRLAEACLRLMNKKLKFNICHIPTSHCFNEAIPNHDALVEEHIPRILLYACQYWAEHLDAVDENAPQKQDAVFPALKDFLLTHILHWLEVLSFTGSMGCIHFSLSCAERYTKTWDDTLSELARDARQFTKTFNDAITASAPHIYLSALPFAPTESNVAQVYGPRHPNTLSVLTGRWPARNEMLPLAEMRGHSYNIACLAYLPDGKRIASGSYDCTIRIWEAHSGRAIAGAILEHSGKVLALSPSPTGDKVASFCNDGTFRVWDVNEYQCTFNMKVVQDKEFRFGRDEISPGWENCAAAINVQPCLIWGTKDGQSKGGTKIRAECNDVVKFLPDGSSLIRTSDTGSIVIQNTKDWDIDGMPVPILTESRTTCLAVSADGKLFASGHLDGAVQLYDYQERRPLGNSMRGHAYNVSCIGFSADGRLLVSGSWDKTLCFWDTKTQKPIGGPHRIASVYALSFSPDGSRLAVAVKGTIQVFHIETSFTVGEVKRRSDVMYISCIAFDKHRQRFATGTFGGVVRVWDVHFGSVLAEWTNNGGDSKRIGLTSVVFVQDSDVIAFSSYDGHVRKWDWKTGQVRHDLLIEDIRDEGFCTISPDGRHIAFKFDAKEEASSISLWDYDANCEVRRFQAVTGAHVLLRCTVFSSDGSLIAFMTSGGMEIWRVAFAADACEHPTCSVELGTHCRFESSTGLVPVFSPDAKQLAFCTGSSGGEWQLHIWDIKTRSEAKILGKFESLAPDNFLSFSPHGSIIVASSHDGTTQFWNLSTGESIGEIDIGHWHVVAAELLNDGTLISVDDRGNIKIWDVELDGGLPWLLQCAKALDPSNIAEVLFVEDASSVPHRRVVRENCDKSTSLDSASISYPAFFDGIGEPVIGDWSYIDRDGWVRNMRASGKKSDDDPILFWVPPASRDNFWWPRITAIMNPDVDQPVTRINFSHFIHGENWHLCGEPVLPKEDDA